jgi:asparagine synthetase B (glutamine-hydrolysing)
MDSACLASYMPKGSDAYTFRFLNGKYDPEELHRAETFAKYYELNLHYVDIDFDIIKECLYPVMESKNAPVHSIEPQLYKAALQAKEDGVEMLVIGDAADYVFYGMDGLLSKDWTVDEFYNRAIYIEPSEVLKNPKDIKYLFERYRKENDLIDFIGFYDKSITEESYASYDNAFHAAEMPYIDPYEKMKMREAVDLSRIRNGESKYYIRALFKMKYPDIPLPEKHPMPRPVDEYFKNWEGPKRKEFREDIDISKYSGNQKWLLWCLEQFLNEYDK